VPSPVVIVLIASPPVSPLRDNPFYTVSMMSSSEPEGNF
jgi:hypothetical protein